MLPMWAPEASALEWRVSLPPEYGKLAGLVLPAVAANKIYAELGTLLHERGPDGQLVVTATNLSLWLSVSVPVAWPAEFRFCVLPLMQSVATMLAPKPLYLAVDRLHVYLRDGMEFMCRVKTLDAEAFPKKNKYDGWRSQTTLGWLRLVDRTHFAAGKEDGNSLIHAMSNDAFATDGFLLSLAKAASVDSMRLPTDAVQWIVRNARDLPDDTALNLAYSSDDLHCRIEVAHLAAESVLSAARTPDIDIFRNAQPSMALKMPGLVGHQIVRLCRIAERCGAKIGVFCDDGAGNLMFYDRDQTISEVFAVAPPAPAGLRLVALLDNIRRAFQAVDCTSDVLLCKSTSVTNAVWLEDAASRHWFVLDKQN